MAVAIGVTGSTIGALIGAGGGVALTPLLTSVLGLSVHRAHGTSLCVVAVTATVGALKYHAAGRVALPAAVFLASTALVTAPLGARFASRTDAKRLKAWFGMFLIAVSILITVLPLVLQSVPGLLLNAVTQRAVMLVVGALVGFVSGLLGIGGGTLMVPALVLLTALPQSTAQGTALLAMVSFSYLMKCHREDVMIHRKLMISDEMFLPGLNLRLSRLFSAQLLICD
jgi:uncharacterized protein